MVQLTPQQRSFVVTEYARLGSFRAVRIAFALQYPHRPVPATSTILRNCRKYQETGTSQNLNKGRSGRRRTVRTDANIQAVRDLLNQDPQTSARRNGLGINYTSFNRITRLELRWHPYKISVRHQLLPGDMNRRIAFCQWLVARPARFLESFIIIADEAGFSMNGEVNSQNVRQYAPRHNPPPFNFNRSDSRAKITVWVGLCGNGFMVGPFFFNANVNGNNYLDMINNDVVPILAANFHRPIELWTT